MREFGLTDPGCLGIFSLCEVTVTAEGVVKQRRLPDHGTNVAGRLSLNGRLFLRNNMASETLMPDEVAVVRTSCFVSLTEKKKKNGGLVGSQGRQEIVVLPKTRVWTCFRCDLNACFCTWTQSDMPKTNTCIRECSPEVEDLSTSHLKSSYRHRWELHNAQWIWFHYAEKVLPEET